MPSIAKMSRWVGLLFICLSMSACKTKVYWINGELSSTDYPIKTCVEHTDFDRASESIYRLRWLMKSSTRATDLSSLEWYSQEFTKELKVIEKVLQPEVTDSKYLAQYQWMIPVMNIPTEAKISVEAVSINGAQMDPSVVKIAADPEWFKFSIDRKASEFELCELSSSIQALIAIQGNNGVLYYYRLVL